jgi:hypothetical protein
LSIELFRKYLKQCLKQQEELILANADFLETRTMEMMAKAGHYRTNTLEIQQQLESCIEDPNAFADELFGKKREEG